MWKVVPVRDQRFRPRSSHRVEPTTPVTPLDTSDERVPTTTSSSGRIIRENEVNAIVKRVRRVASSLGDEKWVQSLQSKLLAAIQERIIHLLSSSTPPQRIVVQVIGLGIGSVCGDTASSVNAASLLQLGLLHALVGAVQAKLRGIIRFASRRRLGSPVEACANVGSCSTPEVVAAVDSQTMADVEATVLVECFDPVASDADKQVCARLGYQESGENVCGAYLVPQPTGEHATLLIAFMPHSSATLYHNIFAVNWPIALCSPTASAADPSALQEEVWQRFDISRLNQLIVLGNYLCDYDVTTRRQSEEYAFLKLMPLLSLDRLFLPNSRSRKIDKGVDGISFADVEGAFSDLSLIQCSPCHALESATLQRILGCIKSQPRIIKGGVDTL